MSHAIERATLIVMKVCPQCNRCFEDTAAACAADGSALATARFGTRDIAGGKYRLDRLIGRGGMGAVYAGTHVELERPVAVKVLLPDFTDEPQALERFRREARAAARLNHSNVADTYDYGLLPEGGAYIVMELVDGINLREHLNRHPQLPFDEIRSITRQVALGVEAAHRRGIVHRDLKPANIMLTHDAHDGLVALVLDFGIAKLKEQTLAGALTNSGTMIGTPRYMSPEQCSGLEIDARSDIYALGVILYEMLTHRPPFDSTSAMAIALKHTQEPPPSIYDSRPDAPADLVALCLRMLAKKPDDRVQTAAEIAKSINPVQPLPSDRTTAASGANDPSTHALSKSHTIGVAAERHTTSGAPALPVLDKTGRTGVPTIEESFKSNTDAAILSSYGDSVEGRSASWIKPAALVGGVFAICASGVFIFSLRSSPIAGEVAASRAPTSQTIATPPASPLAANASATNVATDETAASDVQTSARLDRNASPAERLRGDLDEWVAATNRGDIQGQMSFYAPMVNRFYRSRNLTPAAVEAEKRRLFQPADSISMTIAAVQIDVRPDGRSATTRFHKRYEIRNRTTSRDGEVVQEIEWSLMPGGWKITGERDVRVIG